MIADWAEKHDYNLQIVRLYEERLLPKLDQFDMLVIMGGPMSIHDVSEYPWLAEEKQLIHSAIEAGKRVLGICLGAQLIADVLGAEVKLHTQKEIGWLPITITNTEVGHPIFSGLNTAFDVFHWHGEQFNIPETAIHLASSEACNNQAFLYQKTVLGLQFHLEMNQAAIDDIIKYCAEDMQPSLFVQQASVIKSTNAKYNTRHILYRLLDNWLNLST